MDRVQEQSSDVLLARINRELEKISDHQHRLARKKAVLQEQATRLRLGASPSEVRIALKVAAVDHDERRPWPSEWSRDRRPAERRERVGGRLL
jgi:hypothetical protein